MAAPTEVESTSANEGSSQFQPYIPASQQIPEFTWPAVVVGALLGIIFGASSLYLLLKVGMTVSASVPIAVLSNSIRIVGTGLLVQYWDADKAEGYFHASWGWIIFVISLLTLYLLHGLVRLLSPEKTKRGAA